MSKDIYTSIFSRKLEAFVIDSLNILQRTWKNVK